jgi:3-hydroxyacyl-CoA dehydrogenase/enoyl-CoA hydratase/3-hydroxybutyryl-CoA epimerase
VNCFPFVVSCAEHVKTSIDNGVGIITLDSPGTKENVLNGETQNELLAAFEQMDANADVSSVVIESGKPNSFIAGADIKCVPARTDRV